MFEPKPLDVEQLKVGDIVAVKKPVYYGWGNYLCDDFKILEISKISPKKTKVCFLNTTETLNPQRETFYEISSELRSYVNTVKMRMYVAESMYKYGKEFRGRNGEYYIRQIGNYVNSLSEKSLEEHIEVFAAPYKIMHKYGLFVDGEGGAANE